MTRPLALAALLCAVALAAGARDRLGGVPLEDQLQILVHAKEVIAIDAGGGDKREDLEIGERVLDLYSRGRVALVLTDRRILVVSAGSGSFQTTRSPWR